MLDALNVNGYSIDFRTNDRLPLIKYPFDVTQTGGALTLVGVPVATTGTQATSIANTTSSEIRIRPQGPETRSIHASTCCAGSGRCVEIGLYRVRMLSSASSVTLAWRTNWRQK